MFEELKQTIKNYIKWLKEEKDEEATENDIIILLQDYLCQLMEW